MDCSCKEVNKEASSVQIELWTPKQIKYHTVAFATQSVNSRMIVLLDASLQHFLIYRAEVDKAKAVCAKKKVTYSFMNQVF